MAVNVNPGVYYTGSYWNDLPAVRMHLNERATSDPSTTWVNHVLALRGKPFEKALFLNCGNGWVEREWLEAGAIKSAVGVDYSEELLSKARTAATGLPIEYHQLDTNRATFPGDGYDLVVNHAAGHHVTRLDAVMRSLSRLLPPDGWFVSWDYVGPHRNQYGWDQWSAAHRLNNKAPEGLKNHLRFPDLASMVNTDPTEAIHSELFAEVLYRYFTVSHERDLGGWLAYLLLSANDRLFQQSPEMVDPWVTQVLSEDAEHANAGRTMFRYTIAQPNHAVLENVDRLAAWTQEEERRESNAQLANGRYYKNNLRTDLRELRRSGFSLELLMPAAYHLIVRRLRSNPRTLSMLSPAMRFRTKRTEPSHQPAG
jgi:SAM-dependent methyltransferase